MDHWTQKSRLGSRKQVKPLDITEWRYSSKRVFGWQQNWKSTSRCPLFTSVWVRNMDSLQTSHQTTWTVPQRSLRSIMSIWTWKYLREQSHRASSQCWSKPNYAGLAMSSGWKTTASQNSYCMESCVKAKKQDDQGWGIKIHSKATSNCRTCKTSRPGDLSCRQRNLEVSDLQWSRSIWGGQATLPPNCKRQSVTEPHCPNKSLPKTINALPVGATVHQSLDNGATCTPTAEAGITD